MLLHNFRSRYRFRLLLGCTVILLITMMSPKANILVILANTLLLMLSGINALPKLHRMRSVVAGLGLISVLLTTLVHYGQISYHYENIATAGLFLVLFSSLIHRLTHQRPVTGELLYGLVAMYLQIGLVFAIGYDVVESFLPGSFAFSSEIAPLDRNDFTYFSMITLTTIGYGDIYPVAPVARMLVTLEGVTGVLFIGLSMARSLMLISEDTSDDLTNR